MFEWFDRKFSDEVTENLVGEKLLRRVIAGGQPSSAAIRAGHTNIKYHLDYIGYLADRRRYLAGDDFSIADIALFAYTSCAAEGGFDLSGRRGVTRWLSDCRRELASPGARPVNR